MKDFTVSARLNAGKEDEVIGQITVQAPENIDEAVQVYGGDAILSNALANWRVTLQGNVRSGLAKGESAEALQARLGGAKMGVAAQKAQMDPKSAWLAAYAAADPKTKKKMTEDLMAEAAKLK